jgi:hypothetical protein
MVFAFLPGGNLTACGSIIRLALSRFRAVRLFSERAHEDCRMMYELLRAADTGAGLEAVVEVAIVRCYGSRLEPDSHRAILEGSRMHAGWAGA